ncbi:hypothetical protein LNV08_11815 [Paucibacter sp. TC2R-5]|uniref:hypothetical protein n=1 Tax=Paucibacter sp. TC2R-5 TaxID=2893555 RepID=UPI0021E38C33|nr:hypothetical protein [Paucibacter sp. TC2R-5]MCV2359656.1 hypothetical protein [Paucibacter sp. TC2R-5]
MQIAYKEALEQLGARHCVNSAQSASRALLEALQGLDCGFAAADQAATAIGRVEIACEQLRLIVGSGLVDLAKLCAYAQLLNEIRAHGHQPSRITYDTLPQGDHHDDNHLIADTRDTRNGAHPGHSERLLARRQRRADPAGQDQGH